MKLPLVLASSSPYRKQLLERLKYPFTTASPDIDESALPEEKPADLVLRLSITKAQALAASYPNSLIIGSDQVAVFKGEIITKPGSYEKAFSQLSAFSGSVVEFLTGLCVLNTGTGASRAVVEPYTVYFRELTDETISHYLVKEQPYDCAGSFKSEGLGIVLLDRFEGRDPNALIGLPLIALTTLLLEFDTELM